MRSYILMMMKVLHPKQHPGQVGVCTLRTHLVWLRIVWVWDENVSVVQVMGPCHLGFLLLVFLVWLVEVLVPTIVVAVHQLEVSCSLQQRRGEIQEQILQGLRWVLILYFGLVVENSLNFRWEESVGFGMYFYSCCPWERDMVLLYISHGYKDSNIFNLSKSCRWLCKLVNGKA